MNSQLASAPTHQATSLPDCASGVLITRPEPGASQTAARVAALGFRPIVAPLLEIRALRTALPAATSVQAIVVTSGNAIACLPPSHRQLPLLAVGAASADSARGAGFATVASADGDAQALAALSSVACRPGAGPLLLAASRGQGISLAAELRLRGFRVIRRSVYAAAPVETLPEPARAALAQGAIGAALFFSAETARHAVRLLRSAGLDSAVRNVDAVAIGQAAAVALQPLPWRQLHVASRPNQDAMLALLR